MEFDVNTAGGVVHGYDVGEGDLVVVWHHGTPNIGAPPRPLYDKSREIGIRWASYDRPGYGGSTPRPKRSVATAGDDVAAVAEHLGIDRYAVTDLDALTGDWSWLNEVVGPALANGTGPLIDDDMSYVSPWGFGVEDITAPVLLMHGERDRIVPSSHSEWLADRCPNAELRLFPEDGHISVLRHAGEGSLSAQPDRGLVRAAHRHAQRDTMQPRPDDPATFSTTLHTVTPNDTVCSPDQTRALFPVLEVTQDLP